METEHLAMASIPVQNWDGNLYPYEQALKTGTIFPALDLPFFATQDLQKEPSFAGTQDKNCYSGGPYGTFSGNQTGEASQEKRERLMTRLDSVSFALDDVVLFLDTHPKQEEAITLRRQLIEERKKLLKEFDEAYYPLTKDCEGLWTEGAMPWEGACV